MPEENLTKADVDKAVKDAIAAARAEWETETQGLKDKNRELLGKLREASGVKPEDLAAAESRADQAEAKIKELEKQVGALTKERDTATKNLEAVYSAASESAIDLAVQAGVSALKVLPEIADGFAALHRGNFTVEMVDGKPVVKSKDGKTPDEYFKAVGADEKTKAWVAAPNNSGGGAPGGAGSGGSSKVISAADHQAIMQGGDISAISALNKSIREGEVKIAPAQAA